MSDSDSGLLFNYHDACVYRSDLRILEAPTSWLNDACVHFRLTWLSQLRGGDGDRLLFLDPSVVSYMMHQCDDEDLEDLFRSWRLWIRKMVFCPVNDHHAASSSAFATPGGGNHWSMLMLLVGPQEELPSSCSGKGDDESNAPPSVRFLHFDSSAGYNGMAARAVAGRIQRAISLCVTSSVSGGDQGIVAAEVTECRTPQQGNGYDCGLFAVGVAEAMSSEELQISGNIASAEQLEDVFASFVAEHGGANFAKHLRHEIAGEVRRLAKA